MVNFDLPGPLPTGTTVLEASAGTGKTYAIASLAVRYLATGAASAAELAIITFSRAATSELKDRVRNRILQVESALAQNLSSGSWASQDELVELLGQGSCAEVAGRLALLKKAADEFDSAMVMTIHEFCGAMLGELGIFATADLGAVLVEDLSELVSQSANNVYLRRYGGQDVPPFGLAQAIAIGKAISAHPSAKISAQENDPLLQERLAYAKDFTQTLAARKSQLGVFSFNDQLLRLRDSLISSPKAAHKLRNRLKVALVDEFQDTDLVQWEILRTFHGHITLVLVGDPKQSIYRFRGADLHAYKKATQDATALFSLAVNYRTDAPLVAAIGELFKNAQLGDGVNVEPVCAAQTQTRLAKSPFASALRLRCLKANSPLNVDMARSQITADVVAEVTLLLSQAQLAAGDEVRRIDAGDIAILVSTNNRGAELASALVANGIPAAFSGTDSVFKSAACREWIVLLKALHQGTRSASRRAILTGFVGATIEELIVADETQHAHWAAQLQSWSALLRESGPAGLLAGIKSTGFTERILARAGGERALTDYGHIANELHAKHGSGLVGAGLIAWLEFKAEAEASGTALRKLESDASAVQIMTVHRAKGLQWPVVLLPDTWDRWPGDDDGRPIIFHDAQLDLALDIAAPRSRSRNEHLAKSNAENADDDLRRLYVACTRAQSQLTIWWAPTKTNTATSALQRILYRDRSVSMVPEYSYAVSNTASFVSPTKLAWITASGIEATEVEPRPTPIARLQDAHVAHLQPPATFSRAIDSQWRRTSYSGLTALAHEHYSSVLTTDEPIQPDFPNSERPVSADDHLSPLAGFPGGATFGSLVHEIFEQIEWHLPKGHPVYELESRLAGVCGDAIQRFGLAISPEDLSKGLLPSLLTPLGKLTGGLALADIPTKNRLTELDFEYPLASRKTLAAIADLFAGELDSEDPLATYHHALRNPELADQPLRGVLNGSIDVVLRVGSREEPRFVVVDYKTNSIVPADQARPSDYSMAAMAAEMMRCHYPLQAVLYCVALHRFLGNRVPNYNPAR
ncbi:MAG: UvrD-helicase domain-containing protein, partial [Propionibacteriaceae bacterium]|nr:UvrD-helicase domain-containing protein [Propionibacteriaceae bacterium]